MFKRLLIIPAFCFLTVFVESVACSCNYLEIHEAVEAADVILTGEILGKIPVFKNDSAESQMIRVDIAVRVKQVFKGSLKTSDTIFIYEPTTEINSRFRIFAPCTVNFKPQQDYVIYGHIHEKNQLDSNTFMTGICSRTSLINENEIAGIQEELAPPQTFPIAFKRFFRNLFKGIFW